MLHDQFFVTFNEGELIETYDCHDLSEAEEVRDFLCSSGFEAVIVRYIKD